MECLPGFQNSIPQLAAIKIESSGRELAGLREMTIDCCHSQCNETNEFGEFRDGSRVQSPEWPGPATVKPNEGYMECGLFVPEGSRELAYCTAPHSCTDWLALAGRYRFKQLIDAGCSEQCPGQGFQFRGICPPNATDCVVRNLFKALV